MNKQTKWATIIGVLAAVIGAVVHVIMYWDKLLEKCPCLKKWWEEKVVGSDEIVIYTKDETNAFADLGMEE